MVAIQIRLKVQLALMKPSECVHTVGQNVDGILEIVGFLNDMRYFVLVKSHVKEIQFNRF
jgi:hypothetical protein